MLKKASQSVSEEVKESLRLIEDLKFFLVTAPANWQENQVIRRYYLNNDEGFVSCVFWNSLYFITGTDIVRCILYKFQQFGRTITDRKKFEEGIFSDLRNLKAGTDAVLEEPKSPFLDFLYKNSCLRTQKKQKVFYWFNVPHDKLMADALDRDLKREKMGQTPTSVASREPALSFNYVEDKNQSLFEQLMAHLDLSKYSLDDGLQSEAADSPEYTCHLRVPGYVQEPEVEEEDDDFPLDYIQQAPPPGSREYITLDGSFHSGSYINAFDSDFDNIDASFIAQPITTSIASNEDYLIEQTQPAPPQYLQRSAKDDSLSVMSPPPIHAQYPMNMPSASISHAMVAPYQVPPSAMISQFYDPNYGIIHEQQVVPAYHHEEAWYGDQPMVGLISGGMYDGVSPYYGTFYEQGAEFPVYNPQPSLTQRELSLSMMRKRQQLQAQKGIMKPRSRNVSADYESRIRTHAKRDLNLLDSTETLMPTPESSANAQADDAEALQKDEPAEKA